MLPPGIRRLVRATIGIAILIFLVTLVVLGFQIAAFTWSQETPVMNLPTGVPYLGVPIGALVCALHLVLAFRDFTEGRFEHADDAGAQAE
jgi:TRAP-type C4-dicarboxylate transport system permease small subunit